MEIRARESICSNLDCSPDPDPYEGQRQQKEQKLREAVAKGDEGLAKQIQRNLSFMAEKELKRKQTLLKKARKSLCAMAQQSQEEQDIKAAAQARAEE